MSKKKKPAASKPRYTYKDIDNTEVPATFNEDKQKWEPKSWEEEILDNHRFVLSVEKLIEESEKLGLYQDIDLQRDNFSKLPPEFAHVQYVIDNGAIKHGPDSWLQPGVFRFGARLQSIFRHTLKVAGLWETKNDELNLAISIVLKALGKSKLNIKNLFDSESKLSHMLHGMCNFAFFHTVISRGILKDGDK